VVGLFVFAMGCLACSLTGSSEGCSVVWKKLMRKRRTDDDDELSYIGETASGQPAQHIFETLNELVFFEAPETIGGVLALANTSDRNEHEIEFESESDNDHRLLIPSTMETIFPDLLGTDVGEGRVAEANGVGSAELREPLL